MGACTRLRKSSASPGTTEDKHLPAKSCILAHPCTPITSIQILSLLYGIYSSWLLRMPAHKSQSCFDFAAETTQEYKWEARAFIRDDEYNSKCFPFSRLCLRAPGHYKIQQTNVTTSITFPQQASLICFFASCADILYGFIPLFS